jgi:NADH-quinone oxidoreductase subunit J
MNSVQLFDVMFYVLAATVLLSASVVVFSRNIVYAAFSLLFTLFGVAGLYVLLNADFLAITQLMVYVGGILVLILFGVMLTNKVVSVDIKTGTLQVIPAAILVVLTAGILCSIFLATQWTGAGTIDLASVKTTAPKIGEALITTHMLLFEVASVVLLVAIVGAAMIARREKTN